MDLDALRTMYDFKGRTVVITGGAGILGGEMACALAGCNANVAILDRDTAPAERLKGRLHSAAGRSMATGWRRCAMPSCAARASSGP